MCSIMMKMQRWKRKTNRWIEIKKKRTMKMLR